MNSRNSVNEANLVNYSTELTTLNQLDAKDGLLSFPFDHMYACHSQSADRRQPLQLEKELEVSAHCIVGEEKNCSSTEVSRLSEQLTVAENQNKKLKDLLIYHLDLIQQQNELITKRDKLHQSLKQENETLKSQLQRTERNSSYDTVPGLRSSTITSADSNSDQAPSQVLMTSFPELLMPDTTNLYSYSPTLMVKPERFGITRSTLPIDTPEVDSIVNIAASSNLYNMIENKRSNNKKEKAETRPEPLYTVTTNSGNPVIRRTQRNKKRAATGIGSLSRLPKNPKPQATPSTSKKATDVFDMDYNINKKSKMTNAYGKSRITPLPKHMEFTGSLCDRFKLIDTTPTGEDPYLIGEAEMREQSPIPKLMLNKSTRGRRLNRDVSRDNLYTSLTPTYNLPEEVKLTDTAKMTVPANLSVPENMFEETPVLIPENQFFLSDIPMNVASTSGIKIEQHPTQVVVEPDMDIVKTEPGIEWRQDIKLLDGGSSDIQANFCSIVPGFNNRDLNDFFSSELGMAYENLNQFDFTAEVNTTENLDQNAPRASNNLVSVPAKGYTYNRGTHSRRGKKRALSTTGMGGQPPKRPRNPKPSKKKAAARTKKSPGPSKTTDKPYHTQVGNPDQSWYLGSDPTLKSDDIELCNALPASSTVEVPQWREKSYTCIYTLEGTENMDDKVFEKRHQKLEADERRQLRWHVRRLREQRHTERLRQRQRDSLFGSPANPPPVTYTVWPRPQQDAHFIEISDTLPVTGFGEPMPELPPSEFILPWVRTSKALKRAKRSKTLH